VSKLTEKLRTVGVFNPYGFYGDHPYIGSRAREARACRCAAWMVHKKNEVLDNAWYNYGARAFTHGGRESKKKALADAQAWASDKFGIKEWARDPFGSYGEASFVKARVAELVRKANAVIPS
jgi:hypothetical protein